MDTSSAISGRPRPSRRSTATSLALLERVGVRSSRRRRARSSSAPAAARAPTAGCSSRASWSTRPCRPAAAATRSSPATRRVARDRPRPGADLRPQHGRRARHRRRAQRRVAAGDDRRPGRPGARHAPPRQPAHRHADGPARRRAGRARAALLVPRWSPSRPTSTSAAPGSRSPSRRVASSTDGGGRRRLLPAGTAATRSTSPSRRSARCCSAPTSPTRSSTASRRGGIACEILPCPLAGTTAPAPLSAALALQNAEVLAGLVLVQTVAPGTPCYYGPRLSSVDPRTGGDHQRRSRDRRRLDPRRAAGAPLRHGLRLLRTVDRQPRRRRAARHRARPERAARHARAAALPLGRRRPPGGRRDRVRGDRHRRRGAQLRLPGAQAAPVRPRRARRRGDRRGRALRPRGSCRPSRRGATCAASTARRCSPTAAAPRSGARAGRGGLVDAAADKVAELLARPPVGLPDDVAEALCAEIDACAAELGLAEWPDPRRLLARADRRDQDERRRDGGRRGARRPRRTRQGGGAEWRYPFVYVRAEGSYREIGRTVGEAAREQLQASMAFFRDNFEAMTSGRMTLRPGRDRGQALSRPRAGTTCRISSTSSRASPRAPACRSTSCWCPTAPRSSPRPSVPAASIACSRRARRGAATAAPRSPSRSAVVTWSATTWTGTSIDAVNNVLFDMTVPDGTRVHRHRRSALPADAGHELARRRRA